MTSASRKCFYPDWAESKPAQTSSSEVKEPSAAGSYLKPHPKRRLLLVVAELPGGA